MKWIISILFLALLPAFAISCSQDTTYTVAAAHDSRILVAHDKETMERMIECAITNKCSHLSVMELLPSQKVFLVEAGTKVAMTGGPFSFSNARPVHILEGAHSGQDGWVYDRMLCQDRASTPYQLAFARMYGTEVK
jgi:hypothetical protein